MQIDLMDVLCAPLLALISTEVLNLLHLIFLGIDQFSALQVTKTEIVVCVFSLFCL